MARCSAIWTDQDLEDIGVLPMAAKSQSREEIVMTDIQMVANRRRVLMGAAATAATFAAPAILSAEGGTLKVGVLLPLSGLQAGIGQDCHRAVDVAPAILKSMGLPELTIMNGDTESNVDTARARAEKLISEGAQLLVGAFDSGHTTAIAQVAEQKGIPLIINIAAAPAITEQGYKFVFRNFPTAPMIVGNALADQKEVFAIAGASPKSVVFMHVNDTFGTAMAKGIGATIPKFDMPYTIAQEIAYDPAARELSVEIAKAKATGAEALMVVSRLNDAILLTREMVKQRWSPMAILSMGPGWNENDYFKTLGKLANGPMNFIPWYDPTKKLTKHLMGALAKAHSDINMNEKHVYTFEALLTAADAFKRADGTDPRALVNAIRTTNITDNISIGPGIQFNEKGQNDKLRTGAIQNRAGKFVVIAPKAQSEAEPELPMTPYDKRG
jgi:branched-chain amino acid transport system substrate-binding protein